MLRFKQAFFFIFIFSPLRKRQTHKNATFRDLMKCRMYYGFISLT